jgi:hypothetical protein
MAMRPDWYTMSVNLPEKKKQPPRRNWRYIWIPLLAAIFLCGGYLLLGFSVNLPPVRPIDRLNEARAKWEAQEIEDYRINLHFGLQGVWITVQDEQVVRVEEVPFLCGGVDDCPTYNAAVATPVAPDDGWYLRDYSPLLPHLDDYTMSAIFEFAAEKIKDEPAPLTLTFCKSSFSESRFKISYDEKRGFINSVYLTQSPEWQFGGGLMCSTLSTHHQPGFRINSLDPLPTSAP